MRTTFLAAAAAALLTVGIVTTPAFAITLPAPAALKAAADTLGVTDKVVCFGWRGCYGSGPRYYGGYARPYYGPSYGSGYGYGYGYQPYGRSYSYGYRPSYRPYASYGYGYRPTYYGYGPYMQPHYYYVGPSVRAF